jgi:hypothetical protein
MGISFPFDISIGRIKAQVNWQPLMFGHVTWQLSDLSSEVQPARFVSTGWQDRQRTL